MTLIYLIRHAEAEGNQYRRIQGQFDTGITERGKRQIAALRQRFSSKKLDCVYTSPLRRARLTAEGLCIDREIPLIQRDDLKEIHMGPWENIPFGQAAQEQPETLRRFCDRDPAYQLPGGETFAAVQTRMVAAFRQIAAENEGKTIALVSHAMALRTLLCWCHGWELERLPEVRRSENTAVSLISVENGVPKVLYEANDTHLPEELSYLRQKMARRRERGSLADVRLWFRSWDPVGERQLYLQCRQELWRKVHGAEPFDGESFYQVALRASRYEPRSVRVVMHENRIAGILQLDLERDAAEGVGFIPLCYLCPPYRGQGLGVQLLGEAVSICRPLGRTKLRLRCSPVNEVAKRFYKANGFSYIGPARDSRVPLDLLEKQI